VQSTLEGGQLYLAGGLILSYIRLRRISERSSHILLSPKQHIRLLLKAQIISLVFLNLPTTHNVPRKKVSGFINFRTTYNLLTYNVFFTQ
jgi:hypothetical protein